jgi:SAM-dependent methyltransferase
MKKLIKNILKQQLEQRGLYLTRHISPWGDYILGGGYISAEETVSAAEREKLSVCDYVERLWERQGDTQRVIEQMQSCGAFTAVSPNVLEIGTGTGRYLEKVLQQCKPAKYESYEYNEDWSDWLQSKYSIISHEADGESLKQTLDKSVDLVHSHGVFVYLPFLVSYGYWKEIWRVTADGGIVIFDIYSEDCLDEETVDKWLKSPERYPCFLSKSYIFSHFAKHDFDLINTFKNRHGKGHSEYLVFIKNITT